MILSVERGMFMAKYEAELYGDFEQILNDIDRAVLNRSASATREDKSDFSFGDTRCAVRIYERYSYIGQNRVSMNVTLFSSGERVFVSAITSGGSQAVLFKINTIGEDTFLETITDVLAKYKA